MRLHINIDHIATLRNARGTSYPDPVHAAHVCEQAGADGITVHLREDRRHIRDRDVERLRESITTVMNLEMAATEEMSAVAERVHPDVITLVPERREERTTEGGLDVIRNRDVVQSIARRAREAGIRVSLFVAPDPEQIRASQEIGVEQVELHTGEYCHLRGDAQRRELRRLQAAARFGVELGLSVAAGHGLTRHSVVAIAAMPEIEEVNIGHAVIADAAFMGLADAVAQMRRAIERGLTLRP